MSLSLNLEGGWWPAHSIYSPVSPTRCINVMMQIQPQLTLNNGTGDWNSGACAWTTNALALEHPPNPIFLDLPNSLLKNVNRNTSIFPLYSYDWSQRIGSPCLISTEYQLIRAPAFGTTLNMAKNLVCSKGCVTLTKCTLLGISRNFLFRSSLRTA